MNNYISCTMLKKIAQVIVYIEVPKKSALISYILFKVLLELWPLCYDFRWCETITWGGLFITMPPLYFNLTKF